MTSTYPGTIDTFTIIPPGTTQDVAVGGRQHLDIHNDADTAIIALETKAGAGGTSPVNQVPTGGAVLTGFTDGHSEWLSRVGRNKVRNGGMTIATRGSTPTPTPTDNLGGLDGWRVLMENASGVTVTQDAADVPSGAKYATKLVVGSGNNGKFGIFEAIENVDILDMVNDVGSLQVKLKATAGIVNARAAICQWTGTANATTADPVTTWGADGTNPTLAANWSFASTPINLNPTTSWALYKVAENVAISGSATNLAVLVWNDDRTTTATTDILRIADVQLEHGKVCTDIERLPQAIEAARCRWYHNRLIPPGGSDDICVCQAYSTNAVHGGIFSFPTMRAAPNVTISNQAHIEFANAAFSNVGTGTIAFGPASAERVWFGATSIGTVTLAAGNACIARWNTASGYLDLDADI